MSFFEGHPVFVVSKEHKKEKGHLGRPRKNDAYFQIGDRSYRTAALTRTLNQGCGIKGFIPTSVIQGNPRFYDQISLWEALSIVSQKWSFPTALPLNTWDQMAGLLKTRRTPWSSVLAAS